MTLEPLALAALSTLPLEGGWQRDSGLMMNPPAFHHEEYAQVCAPEVLVLVEWLHLCHPHVGALFVLLQDPRGTCRSEHFQHGTDGLPRAVPKSLCVLANLGMERPRYVEASKCSSPFVCQVKGASGTFGTGLLDVFLARQVRCCMRTHNCISEFEARVPGMSWEIPSP